MHIHLVRTALQDLDDPCGEIGNMSREVRLGDARRTFSAIFLDDVDAWIGVDGDYVCCRHHSRRILLRCGRVKSLFTVTENEQKGCLANTRESVVGSGGDEEEKRRLVAVGRRPKHQKDAGVLFIDRSVHA